MVIEHFKLGVQPFGVTPDTRFLYLSRTHREALASLLYGIRSGRGFTALIAPPGMGKTTLLFNVLGRLLDKAKTAFLFQTLCGPEDLLRSLLADFGIEDEADDISRMHSKLNAYLLEESKKGRQVVVVIDEAQNLDDKVLELVRMLSNFETPGKKLMHLILSGQPQLAEKLAAERLIQLRQRISIVARLNPLSAAETRAYIEHRLRVAGAMSDKPLFSERAYEMIAEQSCGIPRNINNLCFNSMSLACALKREQVDALMVQEAINDLDLTTLVPANYDVRCNLKRASVYGKMRLRFTSWRYSAELALGSFVLLGLFALIWGPSPYSNLGERKKSITRPESSISNYDEVPTSNVPTRENRGEQIVQTQRELRPNTHPRTSDLNTLSAALAARAHKPDPRGSWMQRPAETGLSNIYANDILAVPNFLELGPLPDELFRTSQVRKAAQTAPEQNHVPFEHLPQREKP